MIHGSNKSETLYDMRGMITGIGIGIAENLARDVMCLGARGAETTRLGEP